MDAVEPALTCPVLPPIPDSCDNTVKIPAHILDGSPDLHEYKSYLQELVDKLPDYSFLLSQAFLTLPWFYGTYHSLYAWLQLYYIK